METRNPFNIVSPQGGSPLVEENRDGDLKTRIEKIINSAPVVLFMKGVPEYPQCGFSANVVQLLNSLSVGYKTFDILSDYDIREGVKAYANWPTYPQLWVKGELIGGNDIVVELHRSGELKSVLGLA